MNNNQPPQKLGGFNTMDLRDKGTLPPLTDIDIQRVAEVAAFDIIKSIDTGLSLQEIRALLVECWGEPPEDWKVHPFQSGEKDP